MIRFSDVTKVYPNQVRPALDTVSLEVDKGEFVFLVGASGSGKSTFLRLLLKEERPTAGRVEVLGKDLAKLSNWKVPAAAPPDRHASSRTSGCCRTRRSSRTSRSRSR